MTVRSALIAVAALGACVMLPDYPAAWAPVSEAPGKTCPDLAGVYANESADPPGEYLFSLLRGQSGTRHERAASAINVVSQPAEGSLQVDVHLPGTPAPQYSASFSREKGDFDCDAGWLAFKRGVDASGQAEWTGVSRVAVSLARSSDGFLVARKNVVGAGTVAVLIPVAGTQTTWYRFKRLPAP